MLCMEGFQKKNKEKLEYVNRNINKLLQMIIS